MEVSEKGARESAGAADVNIASESNSAVSAADGNGADVVGEREVAPRPQKSATGSATTIEDDGFRSLGLSDVMLAALDAAGYQAPTPIQAGLIPRALARVDVLGQARTGTGKTAAFVIPVLELLDVHKRGASPQALVLVPTRELAVQVREEVAKLAHGRKTHAVAVYGGKPIRGQIEKLERGAEVVIGTPGRVLDHIGRNTLKLDQLKVVVLDEADRMLDIGFRPDIEKILRRCPRTRQTLLLSATVPPPVERLARSYMRDPESLNFSPQDISVETIDQYYCSVESDRKFDLLERLLAEQNPRQAIIFCRTKRGVDKIHRRLSRKWPQAACIHGDLQQSARDRVMAQFREGKTQFLVATDVVGRGIDVSGISHIVNYDIPQFCDDYVHRVGRTGRMGREGTAYTFVTPEEGGELTRIEMRIDKLLKRHEVHGFERPGGEPIRRPSADGASAAPAGDAASESVQATDGEAAKPAPPPMFGRGGRPPRRIRRAL